MPWEGLLPLPKVLCVNPASEEHLLPDVRHWSWGVLTGTAAECADGATLDSSGSRFKTRAGLGTDRAGDPARRSMRAIRFHSPSMPEAVLLLLIVYPGK